MIFREPTLLQAGLALTLLVLVGVWRHQARRRRLGEFLGGRRAVGRLSRTNLYRVRVERLLLLGLAGGSLALASGEPRWPNAPEPSPQVNQVILALDVSASMQAADVSPTRLARAVGIAQALIDRLEDHRVGLLLFAGTGYPLAPPTHDHDALRFLLRGVTPTIASALDPGTRLSAAIGEAIALLDREARVAAETRGQPFALEPAATLGVRHLVLIGDGDSGEDDEGVEGALEAALEADLEVHTVGVGTEVGAGMLMPAGTYQLGGPVLDAGGARVVSRMQEPLLRNVASRSGGRYASGGSQGAVRELGDAMAEPQTDADPRLTEDVSLLGRYDLPFVFGLLALVLVFAESLLDMVLPGRRRSLWWARRTSAGATQ
ncbi:MAG: VWA domain-containing protein [Gammaproteobacteria bacterium]|nr:VWA domain-containing protein [Gammaproteobacteria bacterium]MDE0249122.1 VWA domain-containing protein [Gammaproteobacteria bacterium]